MTAGRAAELRERAVAADAADPLARLRDEFLVPEGLIYLDGNSLGALPRAVPAAVADAVTRQWGTDLVGSWTSAGWWEAPGRTGDRLAPIIGAGPGTVTVTDSTSVNLYKAVVAAARLMADQPDRTTIVVDEATFPSDRYMVDAAARLLGLRVRPAAPGDADALGPDIALVLYNHVDFRTGVRHDLPAITAAVHDVGALAIWDLCHSAGAMPVDLTDNDVDLAVGCTYKFLNGGPGAPAYVYVARRHQPAIDQPLPGWHSHARPFAMEQLYAPADGIDRMRTGTPPMLSLIAAEAALAVFDGVDMAAVRSRSLDLTDTLIAYAAAELADHVEIVTPLQAERRGSQVSLRHPDAYPIVQALIGRGVVGDFRAPDVIRLGVAPLYLSRQDVIAAGEQLAAVLASGEYRRPEFAQRHTVT